MAYNKLQMMKADNTGVKNSLPASILDVDYRRRTTPIESRSHGHLSSLLQRFLRIFINEDAYMNVGGRTVSGTSLQGTDENNQIKNDETQSLQELENCANAARETEACGQYEWINISHEK